MLKKFLLATIAFSLVGTFFFSAVASNAEAYSYSRNYRYGGSLRLQRGYFSPKRDLYVQPHFKTGPDQYKWNNRKSLYGF